MYELLGLNLKLSKLILGLTISICPKTQKDVFICPIFMPKAKKFKKQEINSEPLQTTVLIYNLVQDNNICDCADAHLSATSKIESSIQNCLMQTKYKQYSIVSNDWVKTPLNSPFYTGPKYYTLQNASMLELQMTFSSNTYTVHEEVLILDFIGLLGSVGGSLGLFIGFSFFDYIAMFMDNLIELIFMKFSVKNKD